MPEELDTMLDPEVDDEEKDIRLPIQDNEELQQRDDVPQIGAPTNPSPVGAPSMAVAPSTVASSASVASPTQGKNAEPFIGDKNWDQYSKWEYDKDVLQKQNPGMSEEDAEHILTSRHGQQVASASDPLAKYNSLVASGAPVAHKHGVGGAILKGLDIAGSTLFPTVMPLVPGTTMNQRSQEQQALGEGNAELAAQGKEAETAKEQADTAKTKAETDAPAKVPNENPQQGYSNAIADAIKRGVDPGTDPHVMAWRDAIQQIQKEPAAKTQEPKEYKQYTIPGSKEPVLATQVGEKIIGRDGNELPAGAVEYKAPPTPKDTTVGDNARLDRSYQYNSTALEKERAPVEAQMQKISAATSNVDLKSPQADALLAPEILSLAAGGAGSGLRMNEAEISRIVGGRTAWQSLQAAINKYSTDPKHPQIPDAQRTQMVQILQAAQAKGVAKQRVLEWAESKLVEAEDVKDHRKIVQQARQFLDAVDNGKKIQRNKATGEIRIATGE